MRWEEKKSDSVYLQYKRVGAANNAVLNIQGMSSLEKNVTNELVRRNRFDRIHLFCAVEPEQIRTIDRLRGDGGIHEPPYLFPCNQYRQQYTVVCTVCKNSLCVGVSYSRM